MNHYVQLDGGPGGGGGGGAKVKLGERESKGSAHLASLASSVQNSIRDSKK